MREKETLKSGRYDLERNRNSRNNRPIGHFSADTGVHFRR